MDLDESLFGSSNCKALTKQVEEIIREDRGEYYFRKGLVEGKKTLNRNETLNGHDA